MNELDLHYPPEACPFCNIAAAFPFPCSLSTSTSSSLNLDVSSVSTYSSSSHPSSTPTPTPTPNPPTSLCQQQLSNHNGHYEDLSTNIPTTSTSTPSQTTPPSFIVLASRDVLAFLDILPMTRGHLLVATREHRVKVADMKAQEGREVGFWLPILARVVSRVTGVEDYNIVQNNGARAAQVVPHVHFHIIPRPDTKPEIKSKSWTMFGRGQRDDLDDEDGASIAAEMRQALREEVAKMQSGPKL